MGSVLEKYIHTSFHPPPFFLRSGKKWVDATDASCSEYAETIFLTFFVKQGFYKVFGTILQNKILLTVFFCETSANWIKWEPASETVRQVFVQSFSSNPVRIGLDENRLDQNELDKKYRVRNLEGCKTLPLLSSLKSSIQGDKYLTQSEVDLSTRR